MKTVFVTGANGLLGQKLVSLLLEKGDFAVVASGRGEPRWQPAPGATPYTYRPLDITDRDAVLATLADIRPDCVVHPAAMTNVDQCEQDPDGCERANVDAVRYLVEACEAQNAFLLHLSTDFIFDGADGPYNEEAAPNPISVYGHSKLTAEQIVRASGLRWAIARTVLVYGIAPGLSRSNIILWVKGSLEAGKEIKVVDDQWRSPTLAEDLAMGCYLIVKQEATGVFNISGKDFLTPYEMALKTADFFELSTETMQRADASIFQQPAKRPPRTGFDISKARRELGYEPRSFEEGIALLASQLP